MYFWNIFAVDWNKTLVLILHVCSAIPFLVLSTKQDLYNVNKETLEWEVKNHQWNWCLFVFGFRHIVYGLLLLKSL